MNGTTEQLNSGLGNTKKARAYIITWNNYDVEELKWYNEYVRTTSLVAKFVHQEEVGESGTPHIQGGIYFKSPRSFMAVKKDLPKCHIEVAKSWKKVVEYCSKMDTRNGTVETNINGLVKKALIDPLDGKSLYPWQEEVLTIIKLEPDERTIHWYWEEDGCAGKTTLAKHICIKNKGAIYLTGKAADMKFGVFSYVEQENNPDIIILDFARSKMGVTISYDGIEQIKNGIFFNTKYESKMVIYNSPHVVCLANWPPDEKMMSNDRWHIVNI